MRRISSKPASQNFTICDYRQSIMRFYSTFTKYQINLHISSFKTWVLSTVPCVDKKDAGLKPLQRNGFGHFRHKQIERKLSC